MSSPDFRRGSDVIEASKSGTAFAKTNFFSLKDGESAVLRFLTDWDDIIVVNQHSMVPTKTAPADFTGNWPQAVTSVCRRDPAFKSFGYADCYVCDHISIKGKPARPQARQWALAVLRESVKENGVVVGFRDAVRRVAEIKDGKPTGNEVEEKAIVVVNMAYNNFFNSLDGFCSVYHTIVDRDYTIRRTGSGLDTVYHIIPMDVSILPDGRRFDLRDPELMARYEPLPDLGKIVTDRSADDYYARFIDTRMANPSSSKTDAPVAAPVPTPQTDVDEAQLDFLMKKVQSDFGAPGSLRSYD